MILLAFMGGLVTSALMMAGSMLVLRRCGLIRSRVDHDKVVAEVVAREAATSARIDVIEGNVAELVGAVQRINRELVPSSATPTQEVYDGPFQR